MRRAAPILLATVLGLVLLLNFRTSPTQVLATPGPVTPTSPTTTSPSVATSPPAGGPPGTVPPTAVPPTAVPPTTVKPSVPSGTRTVDGPAENNRYGTVQVEVTLTGGQIVDVQALQVPNERSRSLQISNYSTPRLRQEALQAQSAHINTVSGATYTSGSYRQSLQAALDQASHA